MGVCRYMYICWNRLATLLLSFCVFCIVGLVFLYYLFFGGFFSSHTGTEICRKKGLVEHYFCFIVVILVKWKWRICFISAYFVINITCPNIFVFCTLFFSSVFFLLLLFFLFSFISHRHHFHLCKFAPNVTCHFCFLFSLCSPFHLCIFAPNVTWHFILFLSHSVLLS